VGTPNVSMPNSNVGTPVFDEKKNSRSVAG
jgi:hypothetical protein